MSAIRRWPRLGEVPDRLGEPGAVVGQHGVGTRARYLAVEEHRRLKGADPVAEAGGAFIRGRDDQAVEATLTERGDQLRLVIGVVRGVGDHQCVATGAERRVRSLCDSREQRVRDIADDEADGACRPGAHAPGGDVGPIPERLARREHAIAYLGPDERLVVQRTRDGGDRNAGLARDIVDRGGLH